MKPAVLFVDDNPVILKTIELAFADEPYRLFFAESGEQGLVVAEKERPGIIVSDLRMPGMNGLDFLRNTREIYDNWIGMIFTAYVDLESVMTAVKEEHVWRYISKPWADKRELVMAVKNAAQYLEAREARRHAEEILARTKHLAGIGQLASGIAHQFNNINACIIGYAEMARKNSSLPPEILEYIETITKSARRATDIIHDLSNFSNYSSKKFSLHRLSRVAKDAIAMLQKVFDDEGVELVADIAATPKIDMDYGLVRLLIMNLLDNAWQATVGGFEPKVYIVTGKKKNSAYVKVTDKGCGISKENLGHVFDPFYSTKGAFAEPNSPAATLRGVGLGLSMGHTIAESHGGMLTVESEPGKGATFTLWLPI